MKSFEFRNGQPKGFAQVMVPEVTQRDQPVAFGTQGAECNWNDILPEVSTTGKTKNLELDITVLGTFFQRPISGKEEKRFIEVRLACMRFFSPPNTSDTAAVAGRTFDKDPSLYRMIGNDCPILSYMIHVFDKPGDWVETPQPVSESILLLPHERQRSRACTIDYDMVGLHPSGSTTPSASTPHSCTTTLAVDRSNPGSHGSPKNGVTARPGRATRADTTPKKTRAPALICFGSKSKTGPNLSGSRPTIRASLVRKPLLLPVAATISCVSIGSPATCSRNHHTQHTCAAPLTGRSYLCTTFW